MKNVSIKQIIDAGDNVRHEVGDVTELAESIKRFGILQPLIVVPGDDEYVLVAGHRRLAAAKKVGLKKVPVVERTLDADQRVEAMLHENIHRENLSILEEADAFRRIMTRDKLTQVQLAERLGISQTTVSNRLQFFKLKASVQRAVLEGRIGLQAALNETTRVHRTTNRQDRSWSERKAAIQGIEVPARVFVLIAFGAGRRPEQVLAFKDRERAFDIRDQLARRYQVLIFPCEVDREGDVYADEEEDAAIA